LIAALAINGRSCPSLIDGKVLATVRAVETNVHAGAFNHTVPSAVKRAISRQKFRAETATNASTTRIVRLRIVGLEIRF